MLHGYGNGTTRGLAERGLQIPALLDAPSWWAAIFQCRSFRFPQGELRVCFLVFKAVTKPPLPQSQTTKHDLNASKGVLAF